MTYRYRGNVARTKIKLKMKKIIFNQITMDQSKLIKVI